MTHRNRALLDLCHEAPCLLLPGQHECLGAPSEPCHSDMIRHGRGGNHKSHDCFAVPGCHNAHLAFTRANLGKEGYHAAWTEAMERWILYLWVSEKIRLTDINQRPKELSMEAPMCKICEHRHYVRDPHQFGKNTSADEAKDRKVGNARRDSSADCSSSRFTAQPGGTPGKNTSREGRRVLKAEGVSSDATRTASTEKPNPPPATQSTGKRGKPEKPAPGKRKTGPKNKRKLVKKP